MSDIFISYARANEPVARALAEAVRAAGYRVWRDDALPAHRPFADVIRERLDASTAVIVIWSDEAVRSHWVQSEADHARVQGKLIQMAIDGTELPMPFDRIQCEPLHGWAGDPAMPGFRKVLESLLALAGPPPGDAPSARDAPPAASEPPPSDVSARPRFTLPGKPSLAVLPLHNLSGDPEQDYFVDGMVIEIVEALSRFRDLFVIDSHSTRALKGKDIVAREVASRLGVRYVLEGHVRKSGGRVRIGIQLIDAAEGKTILTQRFDETLEDVFDLQDKVALAVAGRIEPTINAEELKRAAGRVTADTGSYDLYLRGHAISRSHSREAIFAALDLLEKALALDPDFGLALVRAAHCHRMISAFRWAADPAFHRRRCLELTRHALHVAPDDPTVLTNVSYVMMTVEGDDATALALIDRAIAINPGHARVFYWSGRLRLVTGDTERAIADLERSLRLDPLGPLHNVQIFGVGLARFAEGQFEEALSRFRESDLHPGSSFAAAFMAACLVHLGQLGAAAQAASVFRARTKQSIENLGRTWLHHPPHLALLLEGMRLAEGGTVPVASA
ncbi:MAG: TIR domain-containing protein [Sphingomonadaceae bacterium]